MSDLKFVFFSLKYRLLNTSLSLILIVFGVFTALILAQLNNHFNNRLKADGKNIDIVVGAKGSPLQLVLSTVYHVDIPTGNISLDLVQNYIQHPQIENAIPLALGDNWNGYRIVGTTFDYIEHYNAEIFKGRKWENNFEIIAGSSIDVQIEETFYGSHGLLDSNNQHEDEKYKVVGILKPTNTVIDRLLLTSVDSVLSIHDHPQINESNVNYRNKPEQKNSTIKVDTLHKEHDHHEIKTSHEEHNHEENKNTHYHHEHHKVESSNNKKKTKNLNLDNLIENKINNDKNIVKNSFEKKTSEITAVLITTKSPIANVNLPRLINRESSLQAANPALEITRLTSIFGLSSKSLTTFSSILIIISILSIFAGLITNLDNRMGELAILRAIGYSRKRIFKIIILEGMSIVGIGLFIGILVGIVGFEVLTKIIIPLNTIQANFQFNLSFFLIVFTVILSGYLAAIFPAMKASKINVAHQLTKNV